MLLTLYHTGGSEIRQPDLSLGRSNADFGKGFYLCSDESFAGNWARERTAADIYVNKYEIDTSGLDVGRLTKGEEWYDFIIANRSGRRRDLSKSGNSLEACDIVIGPIAGDTLFETYGIITSGVLPREKAVELFCMGPSFEQVVIRTEKAASALKWISSRVLSDDDIRMALASYAAAKEKYETQLYTAINEIL